MFTVLMVLCIGQNPDCFVVTDLWGPHRSLELCEKRLARMSQEIEEQLGLVIYFEKKCVKKEIEMKEGWT